MFVFRRRRLQEMIDRLYAAMPVEQVDKLVDKLNRADAHRLPAMWETALLDAFARQGDFLHEQPLPGGKRPDLGGLQWRDGNQTLYMVGDITTVSDQGRHNENPIEWLRKEIHARAKRCGLKGANFRIDVGGDYVPARTQRRQRDSIFLEADAKATLSLGRKKGLVSILDGQVADFIEQVKAAPADPHVLHVDEGEAKFAVYYKPGSSYSGGGHLSYTVAASLRRNPLVNALENKADQLKHAPDDAIRLVVACDGGCALFRGSLRHSGHPSTYSAAQIAREFLNSNTTIDLVLLIGTEDVSSWFGYGERVMRLNLELIVADEKYRSGRMPLEAINAAHRKLDAILRELPAVTMDPGNAARRCLREGCGADDIGAWSITTGGPMIVRFSTRALQRLLAGEITAEQFAAYHNWDKPKGMANPFRMASLRGQMIAAALVARQEDRDDDMIELTLADGDAANGPFLKRANTEADGPAADAPSD